MKTPSTKSYPLTLVVRGDKTRLTEMRKKLRILATMKEVTQSDLLLSIILNYLDQPVELTVGPDALKAIGVRHE